MSEQYQNPTVGTILQTEPEVYSIPYYSTSYNHLFLQLNIYSTLSLMRLQPDASTYICSKCAVDFSKVSHEPIPQHKHSSVSLGFL